MIFPIRAFKDNFIWTWIEKNSNAAWVVDPGDALPVINYLRTHKLNLAGILLTHHHADHTGGVNALVHHWQNVEVIGAKNSSVDEITTRVGDNDVAQCGSLQFNVIEIPGHTLDHLAFYNDEIIFTGDTLFSAGCGRVFEGTYPQMYQSLEKIKQLPENLQMYCGHEYTQANLRFAKIVEPNNKYIDEKIVKVKTLLTKHEATLPSTLKNENEINPFLRCTESDVIKAAEIHAKKTLPDPVQVFQVLREWKNVS